MVTLFFFSLMSSILSLGTLVLGFGYKVVVLFLDWLPTNAREAVCPVILLGRRDWFVSILKILMKLTILIRIWTWLADFIFCADDLVRPLYKDMVTFITVSWNDLFHYLIKFIFILIFFLSFGDICCNFHQFFFLLINQKFSFFLFVWNIWILKRSVQNPLTSIAECIMNILLSFKCLYSHCI